MMTKNNAEYPEFDLDIVPVGSEWHTWIRMPDGTRSYVGAFQIGVVNSDGETVPGTFPDDFCRDTDSREDG